MEAGVGVAVSCEPLDRGQEWTSGSLLEEEAIPPAARQGILEVNLHDFYCLLKHELSFQL